MVRNAFGGFSFNSLKFVEFPISSDRSLVVTELLPALLRFSMMIDSPVLTHVSLN